MNHKELYKLLQTVQKNIRCPQCGKEYGFSQIKIRSIMEQIVFLELSCSNHMPVLATVALTKNQIFSETKRSKKVTSDDVLATYNVLKDFKGDFEKIFKKKN